MFSNLRMLKIAFGVLKMMNKRLRNFENLTVDLNDCHKNFLLITNRFYGNNKWSCIITFDQTRLSFSKFSYVNTVMNYMGNKLSMNSIVCYINVKVIAVTILRNALLCMWISIVLYDRCICSHKYKQISRYNWMCRKLVLYLLLEIRAFFRFWSDWLIL